MTGDYFSDREIGPRPRVNEDISPSVWGGIVALVQALIATGAFGFKFPDCCPDGVGVMGTDERALALAVRAEIPDLPWSLQTVETSWQRGYSEEKSYAPATLVALDFIEFCFWAIAKPINGSYHPFFNHHHLSFQAAEGKEEFRINVNRIFARNGVAFELSADGKISRLAPVVLAEQLSNSLFQTGDKLLNRMLQESRSKFLDPKPAIRREALERLWDCWERIKSLNNPQDKKKSVADLLDKAAGETAFRQLLETEASALTAIGNSFHIRHTEVGKVAVNDSDHIDYLFHRLFSMIHLVLQKRGSAAPWD